MNSDKLWFYGFLWYTNTYNIYDNLRYGSVTIWNAPPTRWRIDMKEFSIFPAGAYVQLDGRLKSLILALKHWARAAGVLKKQDGYLWLN